MGEERQCTHLLGSGDEMFIDEMFINEKVYPSQLVIFSWAALS